MIFDLSTLGTVGGLVAAGLIGFVIWRVTARGYGLSASGGTWHFALKPPAKQLETGVQLESPELQREFDKQ